MSKKRSNFFEEHVEKIVLGIIGIICVFLLISRVIISPNYVEYDGRKFAADDVDKYISEQAKQLDAIVSQNPRPKKPYEPWAGEFSSRMDSIIAEVDTGRYFAQPKYISSEKTDKRQYNLPAIGSVFDVGAEFIRSVAYLPTDMISEENTYEQSNHKPGDLDLVTVEAKFDVAELCGQFYENFAGINVKPEWRAPELAVPVFAAVELQRQEHFSNGTWSRWQIVPRYRVADNQKLLEVVEEISDLPAGGIKVRLIQYKDVKIQKALLQPGAYRIASAKEDWLPPSLHKKFAKYLHDFEAQQKRLEKVAQREQREKEREQSRAQRRSRATRSSSGGGDDAGGEDDIGGGGGGSDTGRGARKKRSERESRKADVNKKKPTQKTVDDVYREFDEICITNKTDFSKLSEPLLLWAHDDTVEAGKRYRYRIRLGVFNTLAGTKKLTKQYRTLKDKVILWSDFFEATEPVEIPRKLYFFARDLQEETKTVTVQVSRYLLGCWYSKNFTVQPGEVIGSIVNYNPKEEKQGQKLQEGILVPEQIDFATGATFVDVAAVDDRSAEASMRPRRYFEMLYSFDDMNIEHAPIKLRYWATELQAVFSEIKKCEKDPKEPLRSWDSGRLDTKLMTTSSSSSGSGAETDY
ncbi:MAG: hypothetical protein ACYSRR_00630 [Planctomycetota bacterium]|jgi:uncharacterized membrane protein YgcG